MEGNNIRIKTGDKMKLVITIEVEGENIQVSTKQPSAKDIGFTKTEPKTIQTDDSLTIDQRCNLLGRIVNNIAGGDEYNKGALLKQYGAFKSKKDGKKIDGFTTIEKWKEYSLENGDKWLNIALGNAKKEYIDIFSEEQYEDLKANL